MKLTRPSSNGIIAREHLFAHMDRLRDLPLLCIAAPAGAGKTSLVTSYIESRSLPCLWYQIDQRDTDLATFIYYLGLAAKKAAPKKRTSLPLLTPEYLINMQSFTFRFFEELNHRLSPGHVLVFDNYQDVPETSPLHELLVDAISILSRGTNVILISRNDPPPVYVRLKARQLVGSIGWDQLRLNKAESRAIIALRTPEVRSSEMLQHLHDATQGWTAGLILLTETIRKAGAHRQIVLSHTEDDFFSYFSYEVYQKLDVGTRYVLLCTAFLPAMTTRMAVALSGNPAAGKILVSMNQNNYFTSVCIGPEPTYVYHPLFRNFLKNQAKIELQKDDLTQILHLAAAILEKEDQIESAIELMMEVKDYTGMIRIINDHADSMLKQGRYGPLEEWLNSMPHEIMKKNPWYLHWKGESCVLFNPQAGMAYFEQAYMIFLKNQDIEGALHAAPGIVGALAILGDFSSMEHWFIQLNDLIKETGGFPNVEREAWVTVSMVTCIVLGQIVHPDTDRWLYKTFELPETTSIIEARAQAFFFLTYHFIENDAYRAEETYTILKKLSDSRQCPPVSKCFMYFMEALFFSTTGRHNKCLQSAEDSYKYNKNLGISLFNRYIQVFTFISFLNHQDYSGAEEWINQTGLSTEDLSPPWLASYYHSQLCRLAILRQDLDKAMTEIEQAIELGNPQGLHAINIGCLLLQANIHHQQGGLSTAHEKLNTALAIAEKSGKSGQIALKALAKLYEAHFLFEQGKDEKGLQSLGESLLQTRKGGFVFCSFDNPIITASMCGKAIEAGIETEYVKKIIQRRGFAIKTQHAAYVEQTYPVKIQTLGGFKILLNGIPLSFSGKVPRKPLNLLKALIVLGGKQLKKEHLTDLLWPDADGDRAHSVFATTLSRLRRILNCEKAIDVCDRMVSLNPEFCQIDIWDFEKTAKNALESLYKTNRPASHDSRGDSNRIVQTLNDALQIYQGQFLPEDEEVSWTMPLRESLRNKFFSLVLALGERFESVEQWNQAIQCYQSAMETDYCCNETLFQRLMICHQHLGQPAHAAEVYKQCDKVLETSFGMQPSPKTRKIYEDIMLRCETEDAPQVAINATLGGNLKN